MTNIRKNCLIFDIFRRSFNWIRNGIDNVIDNMINNDVNYLPNFVDDIFDNENNFLEHRNKFIQFLRQIENENIIIVNDEIENEDQYKAEIQNVINNFVINPEEIFDSKYDKKKGEFGRALSLFFLNIYSNSVMKNNKIYYYPNENCEGYGLKINTRDRYDIFNYWGSEWCIIYSNLMKNEFSYKIDGISGDIIEKRYSDGTRKQFRLFYQCKIRQSCLVENSNTLLFIGGPNDIIPYRIIKEHLNACNRWQIIFR